MAPDVDRSELRAYLLGGLDEARASALEARYVADPAWLDAIAAEEHVLLDDALADRLTVAERARFVAHYLPSPVHRDRFAIAAGLRDRASRRTPAVATGRFYGWMAMAAAVILASLWIVSRPGPSPTREPAPTTARGPAREPAPSPAREPARGPDPGQTPSPDRRSAGFPGQARALLAVTLAPLTTRGAGGDVLTLPRRGVDLDLRLEGLPGEGDQRYQVEVETVDGAVVWRGEASAAAAGSGLLAIVRMPAEAVVVDDYVVVVTAAGDERGRYALRVR